MFKALPLLLVACFPASPHAPSECTPVWSIPITVMAGESVLKFGVQDTAPIARDISIFLISLEDPGDPSTEANLIRATIGPGYRNTSDYTGGYLAKPAAHLVQAWYHDYDADQEGHILGAWYQDGAGKNHYFPAMAGYGQGAPKDLANAGVVWSCD